MIDRVSVSQDDDGSWWLGFYADDIRYGVSLADVLAWQEAAQHGVQSDGTWRCACGVEVPAHYPNCFRCGALPRPPLTQTVGRHFGGNMSDQTDATYMQKLRAELQRIGITPQRTRALEGLPLTYIQVAHLIKKYVIEIENRPGKERQNDKA
jgi:hypothetical protein